MDDQPGQICTSTDSTTGTFGIHFGHDHDGGSGAEVQDQRPEEVIVTSFETTSTNTTSDSQSDDAHTSRDFCASASPAVHPPSTSTQESDSSPLQRLGSTPRITSGMLEGDSHLDTSTSAMERPLLSSADAEGDIDGGRQRHRMGMLLATTNNTRLLDATGGSTINQLEGIESSISGHSIVQDSRHQLADTHGQYDVVELHQQTRRHSFVTIDDTCDRSVEVLSEAPDTCDSSAHSRCGERYSGQRITATLLQKSMENTTIGFATATTSTRATRRRPVCRSDNETPSKVRVLETRSGHLYPRRIQSRLVTVSPSLDQSTVEPDYEVSSQTSARTSPSSNDSGTSLAVSPVLPTPRVISNSATDISQPSTTPDDASTSGKPVETQDLEALRLASLNNKFGTSAELSIASREFLSGSLTVDSATNRSYKAAQLAFVAWTLEENVDINNFSDTDVVNFLVHLHHSRHLGLNTLKLWRSAISRFHRSPSSLMNSSTIASFLATVAAATPPRPIHRPTVDLTPTLVYLSKIPSEATTSLSTLQSKLAFLLGMVAFLRPSDLARISLLSVAIDSAHGNITFNIVAPKERRNKIRIIKPFLIHSHHDPRLCPVLCFQAVLHHPKASGRPPDVLFVNPQNPSAPVLSTTISSWLRRLIRLSTSEHRVSVRSLGSSQALRRGISVDDIVTLGNWRSSETFHNFYRREHMSTVNFTTTVWDMSNAQVQVEEIDELDDDSTDVPSLDQQL